MKRLLPTRIVPLLLACLLALSACRQPSAAPTATPSPTPNSTTPVFTPTPDPIQLQLDSMSIRQKVGQLLVAGVAGTTAGETARVAIEDDQVGGVILFGRNVTDTAQLARLNSDLNALNGDYIPLFLCVDEEGGTVSRMPGELVDLPSMETYGKAGDAHLAYEAGEALAAECAAFGFNLDFAPVLDVWSNPDNTVIGKRAFGADPETVSVMGMSVLSGLWDQDVVPVVKHFPGHGDTAADSHYGLPIVTKSVEQLEQLELVPFRAAIDQGAPAVMVAHILMTALDDARPASLSPAVVNGLLREQMGFDGVVCTDDLTMKAVSDTWGMGEAAVMAVEAGCDLLLVCHQSDNLAAAREALLAAVDSGRISAQRLDESVRRILTLKASCGAKNHAVPTPDVDALNEQLRRVLPS